MAAPVEAVPQVPVFTRDMFLPVPEAPPIEMADAPPSEGVFLTALDIEAAKLHKQLEEEARLREQGVAPKRETRSDKPLLAAPRPPARPAAGLADDAAAVAVAGVTPPKAEPAPDAIKDEEMLAADEPAAPAPAPPPPPPPKPLTEGELMVQKIDTNHEPYIQGEWRREPWPPRSYGHLTEYKVAHDLRKEDSDALLAKLKCGEGKVHKPPSDGPGDEHMAVPDNVKEAVGARKPLVLGKDVEERDMWGMDCFTRRNIHLALEGVEGLEDAEKRAHLVEHRLMPAVQSLGPDGWDLGRACDKMKAGSKGDALVGKAADAVRTWLTEAESSWVQREIRASERRPKKKKKKKGDDEEEEEDGPPPPPVVAPIDRTMFRIHPKGVGVACRRKQGIPKDTFVEEYLGELFPPWRWFERQDALKKLNPNAALPDFYNICLERPPTDPYGYDVLFVEAATMGSFASRLSHSCDPNCRTGVVAVNGRLTIAMYTVRDVAEGEELTWDYSCVTESEKEFRAALCLCGSSKCRGSFLYYANSGSFTQVLAREHHFVDRSAAIFRASAEPMTDEDRALLDQHGVRSSALHWVPGGDSMPEWTSKWAAQIVRYMERERDLLTDHIRKQHAGMSLEDARIEALGVRDNRLMNLIITLDKVKYCLRQEGQSQEAPFRVLSEPEAIKYLWSGPESVVRRLVKAGTGKIAGAKGGSKSRTAGSESGQAALAAVEEMLAVPHDSLKDVHEAMRALATTLWSMGAQHQAAGDLLTLYANTDHFFQSTAYKSITSDKVNLSGDHNQKSELLESAGGGGGAGGGGAGVVSEDDYEIVGPLAARGKRGKGEAPDPLEYNPLKDKAMMRESIKKYVPAFIWGQLSGWFKQTVYQPDASLSADRRGSLSLPDPESAYGRTLAFKERKALLTLLEKDPGAMWPVGTIWSFRNPQKVYGSPMLDEALAKSRGEGAGKMKSMLGHLAKNQC